MLYNYQYNIQKTFMNSWRKGIFVDGKENVRDGKENVRDGKDILVYNNNYQHKSKARGWI